MAGSECASLSGSAVVTVSHSTHSDSESVASTSASEHESSYASSSLGDLQGRCIFCVYHHVIHVGNNIIIFDMVISEIYR